MPANVNRPSRTKMAVTIAPVSKKIDIEAADTIRFDISIWKRHINLFEISKHHYCQSQAKTGHRRARGGTLRVFQCSTSQADYIASAAGCTDIPTLPAPARRLLLMASLVVRCIALLTATHISHSLLKNDVPGTTMFVYLTFLWDFLYQYSVGTDS